MLMFFTATATAQPVSLTCTVAGTPTESYQLTFDEARSIATFGSEQQVRATFTSTEISWQTPAHFTNQLDAYFVLNRMTGVLTRRQDVMQYNHKYATNAQQYNCAIAQQKF